MNGVDFLVIGPGSGQDFTNVAANRGQSVAVVQNRPLGGSYLNRSCIPSKLLLYHVDVLETVEDAGDFNDDPVVADVECADIFGEGSEEVKADLEPSARDCAPRRIMTSMRARDGSTTEIYRTT